MALSIAVVCEARADRDTGCDLADRVICQEVDWIEPEVLDAFRRWRGLQTGDLFLTWMQAKELAIQRGIYIPIGSFEGKKGEPDAKATRRVLWLLRWANTAIGAVLLFRDDDRDERRGEGIAQAIRESPIRPTRIIVGLAHPCREAWVIAGFEPWSEHERKLLGEATERLGFDPRTQTQRLAPKAEDPKRRPKAVLGALTRGDWPRQSACWQQTELAVLEQRGAQNGLADYLDDVRRKLVPLLRRDTPQN